MFHIVRKDKPFKWRCRTHKPETGQLHSSSCEHDRCGR
ncbi:hypothetical protein SS05631_c37770 [Sinorhizobium sp. CCBAU 05631]|nr:hypothetical protein SS05631_c37770 [Sinorhizobium sp. CCBAU 05631]